MLVKEGGGEESTSSEEGSGSTEQSDDHIDDFDDLDLIDGLADQAAELDLDGKICKSQD